MRAIQAKGTRGDGNIPQRNTNEGVNPKKGTSHARKGRDNYQEAVQGERTPSKKLPKKAANRSRPRGKKRQ